MSLISLTTRIAKQRCIRKNVAKCLDKANSPISFTTPTQSTVTKQKSYLKMAKNYLSELFEPKTKVKLTPFSKLEPAKIPHTSGTTPISKSAQTYKYIDCDNGRIMSQHKPVTLKKVPLSKDEKVLNVSNFAYPWGSISATTDIKDCIATGNLLQCAGVAIVDKANKMQTLVHCFPGQSYEDITNLLKHTVSKNNKNLDITVISGTYDNCDMTISAIVDAMKKAAPDNKIKFANFSKDVNLFDRAVVLKDGKLTCCTNSELEAFSNKVTNPMDKITYITEKYNT